MRQYIHTHFDHMHENNYLDKIAHFLVYLPCLASLRSTGFVRCCSLVISQTFLIFDYQILNVSIRLTYCILIHMHTLTLIVRSKASLDSSREVVQEL